MDEHLFKMIRARQMSASGDGRRIREAARLSVREVASAVGVPPMSVIRWEEGQVVPQAAGAARWHDFLREVERMLEESVA